MSKENKVSCQKKVARFDVSMQNIGKMEEPGVHTGVFTGFGMKS